MHEASPPEAAAAQVCQLWLGSSCTKEVRLGAVLCQVSAVGEK